VPHHHHHAESKIKALSAWMLKILYDTMLTAQGMLATELVIYSFARSLM